MSKQNKEKVLLTLNPNTKEKGQRLSKKHFDKDKPNLSGYVEHLINSQDE